MIRSSSAGIRLAIAAIAALAGCSLEPSPELGETKGAIATSWSQVPPVGGTKYLPAGGLYRSGEVTDIDVSVPGGPTMLTTAWGGCFVGTAFGLAYAPISDGTSGLPTGKTRSVARNPANANEVIVATGSSPSSATDDWGRGLYQTQNGGVTWQLALEAGSYTGAWRFEKVRWGAGETVFGISNRGVWRSTSGGAPGTWTAVYTTPSYDPSSDAVDIAVDPDLPSWVYVVTGNGALIRSTDSGATWVSLALPTQLFNHAAFDRTHISRGTRIAISKVFPNRVHLMVADSAGLYGLFQSSNFGDGWWTAEDPGTCNVQPTWFMSGFAASPTNANILLAVGGGSTSACRSADGGLHWQTLGSGGAPLHVDFRVAAFGPTGTAYIGSDGGIFASFNDGVDWSGSSNMGLAAPVAGSFDVSAANTAYLYLATWDTGLWSSIGRTYWSSLYDQDTRDVEADPTNGLRAWAIVGNGNGDRVATVDGGLHWDGFNGNLSGSQANAVIRTNGSTTLLTNHNSAVYRTSIPTGSSPIAAPFWSRWPFASTPDLSGSVAGLAVSRATGGAPLRIYAWIDRNPDRSAPATKLHVFDPMTFTWLPSGAGAFATTAAVVRVATNDGVLVYAITDDNRIWRSPDHGGTWIDVTGNAPAGMSDVLIDPTNASHVFVATGAGVYQSISPGVWRSWSQGLPFMNGSGAAIGQLHAVASGTVTYLYAAVVGRGIFQRDLASDP